MILGLRLSFRKKNIRHILNIFPGFWGVL